jgi:hypothetical protein
MAAFPRSHDLLTSNSPLRTQQFRGCSIQCQLAAATVILIAARIAAVTRRLADTGGPRLARFARLPIRA